MSYSLLFFFFNDTATTEIYTLSLHDALPISAACALIVFVSYHWIGVRKQGALKYLKHFTGPVKCLRYRSEEHTSELQSQSNLVCRLLLEKKKKYISIILVSSIHCIELLIHRY